MKPSASILVIDDEVGIRDLLAFELGARGYRAVTAASGEEALKKFQQDKFQLAICDLKMPRMDGVQTLAALKKLDSDVEMIMTTGYGTIETAVAAMKMGAYEFLQKPFDMEELLAVTEKALEKTELKEIVAVHEASRAVFASVHLDRLLPVILELSLKLLHADDVSVMLRNEEGRLVMSASRGLLGAEAEKLRLALGERALADSSDEPVTLLGGARDDRRFAGLAGLRSVKSALLCPLAIGGHSLGALCVSRTRRDEAFAAREVRVATIFAAQAAQSVHNAQLYRQLERNISELQEAYRQLATTKQELLQAGKLAAIGQLAAGVAHELNSPTTSILGFSQLLLRQRGLSAQQREDLKTIHEQGLRCRRIIQSTLQFTRQSAPQKTSVDLAALLAETLRLARYELSRAGITVCPDVPDPLPAAQGDPLQLQQVILNLVINALHALQGRKQGRLSIRIRHRGGSLVLEFADNGKGIPKGDLSRFFDPFFTTKPLGKGTGLGLSISKRIVEQHQGAIRVESSAAAGTTFIVTLPAAPRPRR